MSLQTYKQNKISNLKNQRARDIWKGNPSGQKSPKQNKQTSKRAECEEDPPPSPATHRYLTSPRHIENWNDQEQPGPAQHLKTKLFSYQGRVNLRVAGNTTVLSRTITYGHTGILKYGPGHGVVFEYENASCILGIHTLCVKERDDTVHKAAGVNSDDSKGLRVK